MAWPRARGPPRRCRTAAPGNPRGAARRRSAAPPPPWAPAPRAAARAASNRPPSAASAARRCATNKRVDARGPSIEYRSANVEAVGERESWERARPGARRSARRAQKPSHFTRSGRRGRRRADSHLSVGNSRVALPGAYRPCSRSTRATGSALMPSRAVPYRLSENRMTVCRRVAARRPGHAGGGAVVRAGRQARRTQQLQGVSGLPRAVQEGHGARAGRGQRRRRRARPAAGDRFPRRQRHAGRRRARGRGADLARKGGAC